MLVMARRKKSTTVAESALTAFSPLRRSLFPEHDVRVSRRSAADDDVAWECRLRKGAVLVRAVGFFLMEPDDAERVLSLQVR